MGIEQTDIYKLAENYCQLEKDETYLAAIRDLVQKKDVEQLEQVLRKPLAFGTAGLRAEMGPGFSRMNGLTVIQATQGICAYLLEIIPDVNNISVVVGHDHRHHSISFARLTAAVLLSRGIRVYFYNGGNAGSNTTPGTPGQNGYVCTPFVPFAVSQLKALCGIMITASHNPKKDNGYKVYWSNACQIIPPIDKNIAEKIKANPVPWVWDETAVDQEKYIKSGLIIDPFNDLWEKYFEHVNQLSRFKADNANTSLKFCYTAMHGVGLPFAKKAFEVFGFKPFELTEQQIHPDPEFPTVKFPNPEEGKGVLNLAIEKANATGATVILANDPDADRLAVAEKQKNNTWYTFTGNQLGVMLGSFIWDCYKNDSTKKIAMVNSTVSTKMLGKIASVEGFYHEETLTGFKWLGNKAIELREQGYRVPFAFEEAIGFMCGEFINDKDGISALAIISELAVQLAKKNQTLMDYLNDLYKKYGHFVSRNYYFICHDPEVINKFFDNIRYGQEKKPSEDPYYSYQLNYPTSFAGKKIKSIRDLTIDYDSTTSDHRATLPTSASSQMITFVLDANDCAITLRTSGTEPKIKYYIELSASSVQEAEAELDAVYNDLVKVLNVEAFHFK